jgi:hypothetical protein
MRRPGKLQIESGSFWWALLDTPTEAKRSQWMACQERRGEVSKDSGQKFLAVDVPCRDILSDKLTAASVK